MDEMYANELLGLGRSLTELAVKGTATAISNKIETVKDEKNAEKLRATYDEIVNEYETDYGVVLLKTKLISYQYENPLKLRYELYDGNNLISSVYLMVSYLQLEN